MASDKRTASGADALRGILSDRATREFERRGLSRDLSRTCDAATLRAMLEERGLPVYQAILDFEECCGGIADGPGSHFGLFSVIQEWERPHRGVASARLDKDDLVSFDGHPLLPINDPNRAANDWMGEDGTIYYASADTGESSPDASSFVSFFERRALWSEWEGTPREKRTLVVPASVGVEIATALDLPAYAPATDAVGAWWVGDTEWVIERFEPCNHPRRSTLVHAESMDAVVRAVQAVMSKDSQALIEWYGPNGPPPAPDEPIVARAPWYDYRASEAVGEILFIGSPGHYRVHRYYCEEYSRFDRNSFVWADYGKPVAEIPSAADWPGRQRPYRFSACTRVGAAVAKALDAVPAQPALDSGALRWAREGVEIKEQGPREGVPNDSPVTRVSVPTVEDVVRALEATLAADPRAQLWWDSDNRMPPREGEPIAHRFPKYDASGALRGEILIIGSPGNYRVHSRWLPKDAPASR